MACAHGRTRRTCAYSSQVSCPACHAWIDPSRIESEGIPNGTFESVPDFGREVEINELPLHQRPRHPHVEVWPRGAADLPVAHIEIWTGAPAERVFQEEKVETWWVTPADLEKEEPLLALVILVKIIKYIFRAMELRGLNQAFRNLVSWIEDLPDTTLRSFYMEFD